MYDTETSAVVEYESPRSLLQIALGEAPRILLLQFDHWCEREGRGFAFDIVGTVGGKPWSPGRMFLDRLAVENLTVRFQREA